jgi:hypothetical protein
MRYLFAGHLLLLLLTMNIRLVGPTNRQLAGNGSQVQAGNARKLAPLQGIHSHGTLGFLISETCELICIAKNMAIELQEPPQAAIGWPGTTCVARE